MPVSSCHDRTMIMAKHGHDCAMFLDMVAMIQGMTMVLISTMFSLIHAMIMLYHHVAFQRIQLLSFTFK